MPCFPDPEDDIDIKNLLKLNVYLDTDILEVEKITQAFCQEFQSIVKI